LIRLYVVTPSSLDENQKKLFKELAKTLGKATLPKEEKSFFDKLKDSFGGGA
jgi:DnaJ-class molecular chaperone